MLLVVTYQGNGIAEEVDKKIRLQQLLKVITYEHAVVVENDKVFESQTADGSADFGGEPFLIDFIEEVAEAVREKMRDNSSSSQESLANDIAIAAIKYSTLKGSIHQNSVFDKDKALSFEGDSGPYLQYTNARINSVLEKASAAGVEVSTKLPPPTPYAIEKLIYQFPEVIAVALEERAPHKVTGYLTELAGAFNSLYALEKIADASDEFAPYKAAVTKTVGLTLKQGLWTLGIKAPERM